MGNIINRMIFGKNNKQDLTPEAMQEKSKIKVFFEIFGVKYMELIKLNLLLVVFAIPIIVWSYFNLTAMIGDISQVERGFYQIIYFVGLVPCLLILAPALGGVSYVIRNFTQDRHAWIWSDFWHRTKENLKQSIQYMLIFSLFLLLGQVILYSYMIVDQGSFLMFFAKTLFMVVYIFALISSIYVYPMIVTYDLKLKNIIRNSLLLSMGRLGWTVLFTLLAIAPIIILVLLSLVWALGIIILVIYMLLIGMTFAMYVQITYTTYTFEKYLNKSQDEQQNIEQE